MDIAYLSTLSALAGSVVGGLTSGAATWLGQRAQTRENQLAREMSRRDDLYKDFITAASKAYGEAEPNVQEFVALYAMIRRMRVQSLPQTVACAEKIMRATIATDFAPGKTIHELHELVQSGSGIDLLKDFSEVAREELRAFATL
jgi:hypothetical protein